MDGACNGSIEHASCPASCPARIAKFGAPVAHVDFQRATEWRTGADIYEGDDDPQEVL